MNDKITYRLKRAVEAYEDAMILADNERWNSAVNRLYYASFYAASALLESIDINSSTHQGVKRMLSLHFVKENKLPLRLGQVHYDLFTWRQRGDYAGMANITEETIKLLAGPAKEFIDWATEYLHENP